MNDNFFYPNMYPQYMIPQQYETFEYITPENVRNDENDRFLGFGLGFPGIGFGFGYPGFGFGFGRPWGWGRYGYGRPWGWGRHWYGRPWYGRPWYGGWR